MKLLIHSKKGMNPLVTTILLIAVAVAVGVTFVTYTGSFYHEKFKPEDCQDVSLSFLQLNKMSIICKDFNNELILSFRDDAAKKECYTMLASGTGRVCSLAAVKDKPTWVPAEI